MKQKKAKKPMPKEFQKLIKEFNVTISAIEKAKSDKEVTKHLQKLVNMYDKLFDYIFIYKGGKEETTAIIFNEFWKIPKFQEYLNKCAGGISPFIYGSKSPEQKEFDDFFWFVKGNQANLTEALENASKQKQETAVKLFIKYLTEYIPYSNKEFEKELVPLEGLSADGLRPEKDGKLLGKLNREIVFASLLYLRRYYGVMEGGKKNKEILIFEVEPKIKVVPKKPVVPKKVKKKMVKKKPKPPVEKYTPEEKKKIETSLTGLFKLEKESASYLKKLDKLRSEWGVSKFISDEEFIAQTMFANGVQGEKMKKLLSEVNALSKKAKKIFKEIRKAEKELDVTFGNIKSFARSKAYLAAWGALINTAKELYNQKLADYASLTKPPVPTISAQKGPVIPPEYRPPLMELFPTTSELLIYGPGPVYLDSSVGSHPVNKSTLELFRAIEAGKVKPYEGLEKILPATPKEFIEFIPLIGPTVIIVSAGYEMKKVGPNKENVLHLVLGVGVLALDVWFIGGAAAKAGARLLGRDVGIRLIEEKATGKIVTSAEEDVLLKAMTSLKKNEAGQFLKIASKKGTANVTYELSIFAELHGVKGEITEDVLRAYLKFGIEPLPFVSKTTIGKTWKWFKAPTKEKARKQLLKEFYVELNHSLDYGVMKSLGNSIKVLPPKMQKNALNSVFYSAMTFRKGPQRALLDYVTKNKNGWKIISDKISKKVAVYEAEGVALKEGESIVGKATKDILAEMFPKYGIAYAETALIPWIEAGAYIGGGHVILAGLGGALGFISKKYQEFEEIYNNSKAMKEAIENSKVSKPITNEDDALVEFGKIAGIVHEEAE